MYPLFNHVIVIIIVTIHDPRFNHNKGDIIRLVNRAPVFSNPRVGWVSIDEVWEKRREKWRPIRVQCVQNTY
jgi:hypothetical protein